MKQGEAPAGTGDAGPKALLRPRDALALMVGMVVGIGVFKSPSLVALKLDDPMLIMGLWALGAVFMLIGLLCYAELAATWPDAGGEYHFLTRAFGPAVGFLFAWGRITVVQTGAIAMVAFVLGDYAQRLLDLGSFGSSIYAALGVVGLTALNIAGTRVTAGAQNTLAAVLVSVTVVVGVLGFVLTPEAAPAAAPAPAAVPASLMSGLGFAMIFIMLTYGGWNEAAYLSAELVDVRHNMLRVAVIATLLIGAIYLLLNGAYLAVLGVDGVRGSSAVGADYMGRLLGPGGAVAVSALICVAALTTLNATIFTGARSGYALGRDFALFAPLGRWNARAQGPVAALLVQGALSLALVGFGAFTRQGFSAMVDYTAPVFWFFLTLVGVSVFVLRKRGGGSAAFRVPLYPLTPALFCLGTLYMLHASVSYTGVGALVGLSVVALGVVLWCLGAVCSLTRKSA
ncbi:MAG: amino acid permease [Alphaproteobacteria bacterium]|nr:amino acid permease [Alphaproteobacteria bacterium]